MKTFAQLLPMRSPDLRKTLRFIIIGTPFVSLLVWFYFKVFQLQYLNEDFTDGLVALQLSKSWLDGRPLLYDTHSGFHWLQHNYYFILLVGFVTKWTGIYGLFIVYLGLVALFLKKWLRWLKQYQKNSWFNEWISVSGLVIGPIAYHIFLDYVGWHPEQYFIPLMGLLALSLAMRQWYTALFWGLLTLSVKETSMVLICGLFLFASVVSLILKNPNQTWFSYYFNRRNLIIIAICLAFFCLGMWWLSYLNGNQPSRITRILDRIEEKNTGNKLIYYTLAAALISGIITLFASIPFILWLRRIPKGRLILGFIVGYFLLLSVVFYIEGLYYFPAIGAGIRNPPRIGGLWAFMMSCYVFLVVRASEAGYQTYTYQREWVFFGIILQFIFSPVIVSNNDRYHGSISDINKNLLFITTYKLGIQPYPTGTPHLLYKLAAKLPAGAEVISESEYINIFQKAYARPWICDDGIYPPILTRPLLFIHDKKRSKNGNCYNLPTSGYITVPNAEMLILADSVWYSR